MERALLEYTAYRKDGGSFIVQATSQNGAWGRATRMICGLKGRNANKSRKWKAARDMIDRIELTGQITPETTYISYKDGKTTRTTVKNVTHSKMELFATKLVGIDEMVKLGLMTESEKTTKIKEIGKELGI